MDPIAAVYVPEERLRISAAASAEVAAAAMDAATRAGLADGGRADFIVMAVPAGEASADLVDALEATARAFPAA